MPITYTNRKGFTYFLNKGVTKTGKPRYYFAREQKGEPVDEIPAGYEIEESVNAIVSLVKARPQLIRPNGSVSVENALKHHAERWCYNGSIDDWIHVGHSGKIEQLAKKLTPKLGTAAFFEIY